jgi:hypothetical protein
MYETEQAPALVEQAVEYRPTRSQALRDYRVEIEFLSIGCVIRVGCKAVPFTSVDEAMKELNAYVKDPVTSQKVWNKRFEDYDKQ